LRPPRASMFDFLRIDGAAGLTGPAEFRTKGGVISLS